MNRTAARKWILDYAKRIGRGDQIKQIAPEVYDAMEFAARRVARRIVERHPSAFKTLKAY